jgi:hypothetical protein
VILGIKFDKCYPLTYFLFNYIYIKNLRLGCLKFLQPNISTPLQKLEESPSKTLKKTRKTKTKTKTNKQTKGKPPKNPKIKKPIEKLINPSKNSIHPPKSQNSLQILKNPSKKNL